MLIGLKAVSKAAIIDCRVKKENNVKTVSRELKLPWVKVILTT